MNKIKIGKLTHKRPKTVPRTTELVIVGLTPGRVQHEAINSSKRPREGAFKGPMRKNIYKWFEGLGINEVLGVNGLDDLYTDPYFEKTVFMTSLLREPVYYSNGKNYSGRNPVPWKDEKLSLLVKDTIELLSTISDSCLIVPCGDIVGKCLLEGLEPHGLSKNVLEGFPHPSPINSHGPKKFETNKRQMRKKIRSIWNL